MNEKPTWCHLLFYFTYYALNMFRTLMYPSSGACGYVDEITISVVLFSVRCVLEFLLRLILGGVRFAGWSSIVVLLKMDILMPETCWAHNKWNKIVSDIKLVFHSSTISNMFWRQFVTAIRKCQCCQWATLHIALYHVKHGVNTHITLVLLLL